MLLYQNLAELDVCHLCSQMNAFTTVATFVPAVPHMPRYLGMGYSEDRRMWLAMPHYGDTLAGLRDPTSIVAAAKQASAFRLLCHNNIINGQDVLCAQYLHGIRRHGRSQGLICMHGSLAQQGSPCSTSQTLCAGSDWTGGIARQGLSAWRHLALQHCSHPC